MNKTYYILELGEGSAGSVGEVQFQDRGGQGKTSLVT